VTAREIHRPRVAVIDDNPAVLKAIKRLLGEADIDVEGFGSAEDFLVRTASDALGCLIVDVGLPGISGIELRRRLAGAGSKLPVIFITASEDESTRQNAMSAGAFAYLRKPFSGLALVDAVVSATSSMPPG
jgi:FixJ family two-component response regulator